jgi:hypothetical protein
MEIVNHLLMLFMEHGLFIDGLPLKNGDFPVRDLKLPVFFWEPIIECYRKNMEIL